MTARLLIQSGLWALLFEGAPRPQFTRFASKENPAKVLRQVQREFPGVVIESPTTSGWLFDAEELREYEMSASPLFSDFDPPTTAEDRI